MAEQTLDLLGTPVAIDPLAPAPYHRRERVAHRKLGAPAHFHFYQWRCDDADGIELTGCVVTRLMTKGPRAGRPDYKSGPAKRVTVTEGEYLAECASYELTTGRCAECLGTGKTVQHIDFVRGVTDYRECSDCAGSGVAKAAK